MKRLSEWTLAALLVCTLIAGCSRVPRTRTIVIVTDKSVDILGESPARQGPATVYLFRVDQKPEHLSSQILHFSKGKAGETYIVDEQAQWTKVGTFDTSRSDQQLIQDYGVKMQ